MARLTGLSKGLITLAIVGGTAAVAWHLGLKEVVQQYPFGGAAPAQSGTPGAPVLTLHHPDSLNHRRKH